MGKHYRYTPGVPLAAFIQCFWLYEGDAPDYQKERRLPDGSLVLIFNLREDELRIYDRHDPRQFHSYRGGIISGAQSTFSLLDTANQTCVMGVEFRTGGALPFLPFPVAELHNAILSLDLLWGAQATDLRGALQEACTCESRFSLLEQFLLRHILLTRISHPVIPYALKLLTQSAYALSIADLSEQVGLSSTRFIQIFRDTIGLTPRQFVRLQRFQQALHLLKAGSTMRGVDLALSCGYFDQAHFIHDFQNFSGLTPGTYLSLRGEFSNHVPFLG